MSQTVLRKNCKRSGNGKRDIPKSFAQTAEKKPYTMYVPSTASAYTHVKSILIAGLVAG